MSFERYPKYSPSGVEWLGDIPESWVVRRIKHVGKTITGGTPKTEKQEYWIDGDVPWLPSGKVQNNSIHREDVDTFITRRALEESAAKLIRPGSALIALTGATCANVAFLTFESTANQSVVGIEPKLIADGRFIYYALLSQREQVLTYKSGGAQGGINQEDVRNIVITVPEKAEQAAIAEFLEWETRKVDMLVAEQRRLMELLKEKRQAVISHAVTKGLNPHAPMKPSGIEWLGDVPAAWELCALRHSISEIFNGISANQIDESATTVPVTRIETISFGSIDESRLGYIEFANARRDRKLQVGDILFSNINSLNMIGNCAYYFGGREIYAGMNLLVIRAQKQRHARWLYWLIRSPLFRQVVESLAKPSVNQASIPQSSISGIVIAIPPPPEQLAIAEFLDAELFKFDTLTTEAQRAIGLLQERRTALISAAVTGQIDVRKQPKN
jgi:type I restriction enzyme S subunit